MDIFEGLNLAWNMIVSIFSFSMCVGFTMMASGGAFSRNYYVITAHNVLIICISAVVFFIMSHTLTQHADGGIIGSIANVDIDTGEEMDISLSK